MSGEGPGPVYFLLHVPRTGGQTRERHFLDHSAPGTVWSPKRREAPPPDPDAVRVVVGHHQHRSQERLFEGREIRRAVLLREPLNFHISLYNFRMMNRLRRGWPAYDFDAYLRAAPRDMIAHFLLSRWLELPEAALLTMPRARKFDLLNRELERFWFVGAYTDGDRLIEQVAAAVGVPPQARKRNATSQWSRRVDWRPLRYKELGAEKMRAIIAQHPVDRALWQTWRTVRDGAAPAQPWPLAASDPAASLAHELLRPAASVAARVQARLCPTLRPLPPAKA